MTDPGTAMYFFAVVGGAIILGIAMAYGIARNKHRSRAEKLETERGTHRLYEEEERKAQGASAAAWDRPTRRDVR
jgi:hypothetical protein